MLFGCWQVSKLDSKAQTQTKIGSSQEKVALYHHQQKHQAKYVNSWGKYFFQCCCCGSKITATGGEETHSFYTCFLHGEYGNEGFLFLRWYLPSPWCCGWIGHCSAVGVSHSHFLLHSQPKHWMVSGEMVSYFGIMSDDETNLGVCSGDFTLNQIQSSTCQNKQTCEKCCWLLEKGPQIFKVKNLRVSINNFFGINCFNIFSAVVSVSCCVGDISCGFQCRCTWRFWCPRQTREQNRNQISPRGSSSEKR